MIGLYDVWKLLILQCRSSNPVMVLTSYLDDSGSYEDPMCRICCVAGCVSPEDSWNDLITEWNAVLIKYEVDYLHMKEYAHSPPNSQFSSWKGDENKRQSFLSDLMDIVERKVMAVVGATVPIQDFKKLTDHQKRMVVDPLFMCVQEAFHQSSVLAMTYQTKIKIRFSNDDKNKKRLKEIFETIQRTSQIGKDLIDFDNSKDMRKAPPLQAADLVAYELHHFAKSLIQPDASNIRVPMKRLFRENYFFTFFDHNSILKRFYFSGPGFVRN